MPSRSSRSRTSSSATSDAQALTDFDALADQYDRLRPADGSWHQLLDVICEEGDLEGRRVLDVGCGTGRLTAELAARGARVWGVDASTEMLRQARARCGRSVGLRRASAERLPFEDAWFERVVLRLVVHLVEREHALPELARVLLQGGRAVIATFRPEHFEGFWLNPYFPSIPEIDRARFPDPAELARELGEAGFEAVRERRLTQERRVSRGEALERIRGRYISTLELLPPGELETGMALVEATFPEEVTTRLDWAVVVAER